MRSFFVFACFSSLTFLFVRCFVFFCFFFECRIYPECGVMTLDRAFVLVAVGGDVGK